MKNRTLLIVCIVATALATATVSELLRSGTAFAGDGDPATSDITSGDLIVPYDGYLALDNTPMNGTLNLRFELYDDPSAGTQLWTEDQAGVTFYNGRFSVGLGSVTPVTATVLDAEKVYLAISIDDGTGTYFALSGRQAIEPVPYAAWSASAANFKVEGDLTVEGNAMLNGDAIVNNRLIVDEDDGLSNWAAIQAGQFTVDSQDGQGLVNLVAGAKPSRSNSGEHAYIGDRGASRIYLDDGEMSFWNGAAGGTADAIVNWVKTLTIAPSGNIRVHHTLYITDNLNVDGTIAGNNTIGGDLTVNGDITNLTVSGVTSAWRDGVTNEVQARNLMSTNNSICFLTKVGVRDVDGGSEIAECAIIDNGGTWVLQARIPNAVDQDVFCAARCLSW